MIPSIRNDAINQDILSLVNNLTIKKSTKLDLEKSFSNYLNVPYLKYTHSGINSLYLLLKAYGLKKGDEVATPSFGCESIARLIYDLKLKPLYIDTNPQDSNISISDLSEKVSKKNKGYNSGTYVWQSL